MKKSKCFFGILALCLSLTACQISSFNIGGNSGGNEPASDNSRPIQSQAGGVSQEKVKLPVSVSVYGNGSVTPSVTSASIGEAVYFTITPNFGYRLDAFYVNNEDCVSKVSNDYYVTVMPESGLSVYAVFSQSSSHDTSSSQSPSGGSSIHKHSFYVVDEYEPTCTEDGYRYMRCDCGQTRTSVIPAIGHSFITDEYGNEVIEWAQVPTCTTSGYGYKRCSVCGEWVEAYFDSYGHNFEDYWEQPATCTTSGYGRRTCLICGYNEYFEQPPLGHDVFLVGDVETPPEGQAAVRLYQCYRCGEVSLGFNATEVTDASRRRLVFLQDPETGDTGARFFGRPIGNDIELNDDGAAAYQENTPSYFNKYETGDYFEYIFELTKEQAASLQNVRCYCDAKPAAYLGKNGFDFWARDPSAAEWTPGYYTDDDPEHLEFDDYGNPVMVDILDAYGNPTGEQVQKGREIFDYRYILYVDDVVQQFDGTPCRVPNSEPRAEYMMPFTFSFHEGLNKISLRMSGGFRSIFYNFIFRPINIESHTHSFGKWVETKSPTYTELGSLEHTCSCGEKEQMDVNTLPFNLSEEPERTVFNDDGKVVNQYTYDNGNAKVAAIAIDQNSGIFETEAVDGQSEKWTIGVDTGKASALSYKMDKGTALLFKINVSAPVKNAFISIGAKYYNSVPRHFYNELDAISGGSGQDSAAEDGYRYYTKVNDGEFQPIAFNSLMSDIFDTGQEISYMPLGHFNLKAGENLIYVRQGILGYRVTLQGKLFVALSGGAVIIDSVSSTEVGNAYPMFRWSDAIQEGSSSLDNTKFERNSTYILKVNNVPSDGTYTITLPMKGSANNGSRTLNGSGQGFSISANDVLGTFYGEGRTYEDFFGADQTAWVNVLFGEIYLNAGTNFISIMTNSGGYRVNVNPDGYVTLAVR